MTEKEAIKVIRKELHSFCESSGIDCFNSDCENCKIIVAYEKAIKALEKQIPKKPKNEYTDNLDITTESPACPVCGNQSIDETNKYCSDCGQALDWGEYR